ncbi:MAG: MMPL family transporter [Acidiferrobacterales bacterium]|nr:MMPL family transporter [Acidiferrobacterales bacterium]
MTRLLENALFDHKRWVIAVFLTVTLAMGWFASQLTVDAGFTKLVPVEHPYMETFLQHRDEFGGADRVLVAIMAKEGDIFSTEFIDLLRQVTDAVFFLPGVDRTQVFSILTPNVRYLEIVEDGIESGNVLPVDFKGDDAGFLQLRENILKSGVLGRLVANDFSGAVISARLQEFHPGTGEQLDYVDVANQLENVRETALAHGDDRYTVHIIGFVKVVGDIASGTTEVIAFFGIAIFVIAIFVYIYLRSVPLTATLLACSLLSVVWQLGILNVLGFGIDPMSILIPFLVFAIAISHGVQVVNATHVEFASGLSAEECSRAGFRRVLKPGMVALVSDAIGFVTIAFINVQVIQEIAIAASIGVAGIILTNLGLLPVLLTHIHRNNNSRSVRIDAKDAFLSPVWVWISRVTQPRNAALVIVLSAVLALVGIWNAPKVRIGDEHSGVPELRANSVYNQDAAMISNKFSIGVDVLTVIAETKPDGCIDYDILSTIDAFEWQLRNVDGVQSVSGLAGTARHINAAWNEGNLKWSTLPRNHYQLVQAVSPVQTSSGLLNADCSVMPVHIYTTDHKAETIERVVDAVKEFNHQNLVKDIEFKLASGNVGVMAATNEEVEASQFPILGYVFAAVTILCLIAFRSLTAVLCVIIPLAIASLLAYTLMAILEIGLKVSTLPVVALGIGVGVDYGIYFYGRIRTHMASGSDFSEAFEKTLVTVGSGVVLTGMTLAVSIATWLAASLKFQADMGAILTFMFIVNMIGAILLLPALGVWLEKIKPQK